MANEVRVGVKNALPMQIVDDQHVHLHMGELNYSSQVLLFSSNLVKKYFSIVVATGVDFHWEPTIEADGPIKYELYENAVIIANSVGTAVPNYNMNRNFTTSCNTIFYANPSSYAVSSFNLIYDGYLVGSTGGGVGPTALSPFGSNSYGKFILKAGGTYLIQMQNTANSPIEAHFVSTFYEE